MMLTLMEHLLELRKRLLISLGVFVIAFIGAYPLAPWVFDFLVTPLAKALQASGSSLAERRLIFTHMAEAFLVYIKITLFVAFFLSFPLIASQIWIFLAPGLYKNEKKAILPFFIMTPLLFLSGAAFVYFLVIPQAWKFFLSYETVGFMSHLPLQLEAKVNEYLTLTLQLIMAFGVCFQLPVVLVLLARIGVVSATLLRTYWKYALVGILIVSAFLTPPDVLSMIGLALPLYGLYECSILMVRWVEKRNHSQKNL